jgi:surface protein
MNGFLILIIVAVICVLSFLTVRVFINNDPNETPVEEPMILKITVPSDNSNFELPFTFSSGESVEVDWGDNSEKETFSSGTILHTYNTGDYIITINGKATSYGKVNYIGVSMITEVVSWGTLALKSLANSFYDASNLTKVPTTIPSSVTDLSFMFAGVPNFNQNLNNWDTRNITNMEGMFSYAISFNQPITWNTDKVTNMELMFYTTTSFNQPIHFSNTSNVKTMRNMFAAASIFNQPITFNTSKVTDMSFMFADATLFDQPLDFDTSNVTTMSIMFNNATSFNQPITFSNTSNVTNMSYMFGNATSFNQPLNFNTSSVITMEGMFSGATIFNKSLKDWDVGKVIYTRDIFNQNPILNNAGFYPDPLFPSLEISPAPTPGNVYYGSP